MRRRLLLGLDVLVVSAAVAVTSLPVSPAWIEQHYSNGLYPAIDQVVRALSGPLPFALGDVLALALGLWLVRQWVLPFRAPRGRRAQRFAQALRRTVVAAAAVALSFEVLWGYNYARIPLAQKIPIDERRVTPQALDALATRAAAALDSLAPGAHAESPALGPLQRRLVPSFEAVIARLGDRARFAPPRVKPTIFALFFGLSGTSGFTDPWTHEINLDPGATAVERPALYAHEWGHLSGFADETEANYISVLACTRSHDPLLEYSGWLLVWFNLPQSAHPARALSPLADADVGEIVRRYLARRNPLIERIQRLAYGAYLQRNGVATGYASYSLFVRWLLGARYDRGGLPLTARLNE